MEYQTTGRKLLLEMVANKEEDVMPFYSVLKEYYSYLLSREHLTVADINRYNSLAVGNVYNPKVRSAILER